MTTIKLSTWLAAIFATTLVFLVGDFFVIPNVMRPIFKLYLGPHMLDELRLLPAALFYIIHIFGIVFLAVAPALRQSSSRLALVNGGVLGLVAYSCYEMTSWTIMTNWHFNLVIVDTAWGVIISAVSAWFGAFVGFKTLKRQNLIR